MQTIPDAVLDVIVEHRPQLATMVNNLRAHPEQAPLIERAIATTYLLGTIGLSGQEAFWLSQVANGGPWGGDWLRSAHAAELLGVDESRIRQLVSGDRLNVITRGKTHYISRESVNQLRKDNKMLTKEDVRCAWIAQTMGLNATDDDIREHADMDDISYQKAKKIYDRGRPLLNDYKIVQGLRSSLFAPQDLAGLPLASEIVCWECGYVAGSQMYQAVALVPRDE